MTEYRSIGQTVYRTLYPTIGPFSYNAIGIRRGKIIDIHTEMEETNRSKFLPHSDRILYVVEFDVDVNWHSLWITCPPITIEYDRSATYYHRRVSRMFNFGCISIEEIKILAGGGLLGPNGIGVYDEPIPDELKELYPMYEKLIAEPDNSFTWNPVFIEKHREEYEEAIEANKTDTFG